MNYFSKFVFYTNPCGHKTLVTDTFREFAQKNNVSVCRKCKKEGFK